MRPIAAGSQTARWAAPAVAAVAMFLTGCGGEGFSRHEVRGTVTFRGQPVSQGLLVFEPEESVGNVAPTCYAVVKDGEFVTDPAKSPTSGMYRVRVRGVDQAQMKPGVVYNEDIPALFPEHVINVEIPPPDGRLVIEVPDTPTQGDG